MGSDASTPFPSIDLLQLLQRMEMTMPTTLTLDKSVPGDPSGRALGIGFSREDAEKVLRRGLDIVEKTMPTLEATARGIIAELDDPKNPLAAKGSALIKIDRKVDEKLLSEGKLKVLDCDKEKILALLAALGYEGSERAQGLRDEIMGNLAKGGIPLRVEGEPKLGGSIQIRIFDQSLELRFVRPA